MPTFMRQLQGVDYGIIAMTLLTAVIHIILGSPLFILNGVGYLGLLAVVYLPVTSLQRWRRPARWTLLGYTALTVVLYFIAHADGSWMADGLGLFTKLVEIILILLLLFASQTNK